MLYTTAAIIIALWLLGSVSGHTMGIHAVLVVAVIVVLLRVIQGRKALG